MELLREYYENQQMNLHAQLKVENREYYDEYFFRTYMNKKLNSSKILELWRNLEEFKRI